MKKTLVLVLFLIFSSWCLFFILTKFPLQKPALAQTCQDDDLDCPEGCAYQNDNDCPILPVNIHVSSELDTDVWNRWNLVDGDWRTSWSSKYYGTVDPGEIIEWASFDFGQPTKVARIVVIPRVWEGDGQTQCFPPNWNLSFSDDGVDWRILPGREFTNYRSPNPVAGEPPRLIFSVNTTHRYFGFGATKSSPDSYGDYFVQLAEIEFYEHECLQNSDCPPDEVCREGVCGISMEEYWNLKPGNYWIMTGKDYYGEDQRTCHAGSPLEFRERYDLERKTKICRASGNERDVLTWRMTRNADCPAPHLCYWGNMRFMLADPDKNDEPYIWAFADNRYNRREGYPDYYTDIGEVYERNWFKTPSNPPLRTYLPPYLYTPRFLTDFGDQIEFHYEQNHCGYNDLCNPDCKSTSGKLIMRYKKVRLDTPAYQGPAILVSQGEENGWCTREDWYLAKGIGLVRVDQWSCDTSGKRCYDPQGRGHCSCSDYWYDNKTDHPNCYQNIALDCPPMTMELEKYYLGYGLDVKLNRDQTEIVVTPGKSFTLKVVDPHTNFTYEGFLESQADFISSDGTSIVPSGKWDLGGTGWVNESGEVVVTLSDNFPEGIYTTRLRPWVFPPPQGSSEEVTEQPNLPWSNLLTIRVGCKIGDIDCDDDVDTHDVKILIENWGKFPSIPEADLNKDGIVNGVDFGKMLKLIQ